MQKAPWIAAISVAMLCSSAMAQNPLPAAVSYPSVDSGWTKVGNVTPLNCAGSACQYELPDIWGTDGGFNRTIGDATKEEVQVNELIQVQSNGQSSYASLLVNLPSTQNYKIAVDMFAYQSAAPLGGQVVWPVLQIVVNGTPIQICKYTNSHDYPPTTALTVNNGTHAWPEYAESCSTQIFGGNNNIAVQVLGGQGHGGQLAVRHVVVYQASGIAGNVTCYFGLNPHTTTISSPDIWQLVQAADHYRAVNCFYNNVVVPVWINLRTGFYNALNNPGCNGTEPCALVQADCKLCN